MGPTDFEGDLPLPLDRRRITVEGIRFLGVVSNTGLQRRQVVAAPASVRLTSANRCGGAVACRLTTTFAFRREPSDVRITAAGRALPLPVLLRDLTELVQLGIERRLDLITGGHLSLCSLLLLLRLLPLR